MICSIFDDGDILDNEKYINVDADTHQEEPSPDDHQGPDKVFIEGFPSSHAAAAVPNDQANIEMDYDCYRSQCGNSNEYAPFTSRINWDIAHWAKVHGITSTAVTELLRINGVGFYSACYV